MTRAFGVGLLSVLMLVTAGTVSGCTKAGSGGGSSPGPAPAGARTEAAVKTSIAAPNPGGAGSVATTVPDGSGPTKAPVQAGDDLAKQALPTNQWWTSALTGPRSQPMWAHPLAVQAADDGVKVSSAAPVASANSVITPFDPAITAGGPISGIKVVGYGAFHVVLRADLRGGGWVQVTLVQGSPVLYLEFHGATPALTVTGAPTVTGDGGTVRVEVAGQRFDLLAAGDARWRRDGGRLTTTGSRIAVARVPDGVDESAWRAAIAGSASDPVVATTANMAYSEGTVTQTLTATRRSGKPGVWALLPHQKAGLAGGGLMKGTFADALGPLALTRAGAIEIRVPMPGLLTAVPSVPLPDSARAAIVADLDRDLADKPGTGGSYFGLKELGRLATIAEVAGGVGAPAQRQAALDRLRPQLVDWLTYSGPGDAHYFGYDKAWGGLIAVPAEFGSNDYNDHHFQYGYLVRAAAVLAAADPGFRRDYGGTVDLVARDYAGGLGAPGFPAFRVFNAYLGHSAASGFGPFADGNNQESSSEAVAAWEAIVRWGLVRGNQSLVTYGVTHYALEAATARMYWLGEGLARPPGYAHLTAGIVWDAKYDYATFFDAKPESVQGIQLLPLTIGSLYRADPAAAAARAAAIGSSPAAWGDLFAADLAVADPVAARQRLSGSLSREDSTSRAMVRYWVELLAAYGPPQPGVVADGPYGLAFGSRNKPALVAADPTGAGRTVTFTADGAVVGRVRSR